MSEFGAERSSNARAQGRHLALIALVQEHTPDAPNSLADLVNGVFCACQSLQRAAEKDADRAGEKLRIEVKREHLGPGRWACSFLIVGKETGAFYGDIALDCIGQQIVAEKIEQLENYISTSLLVAINGPARFDELEKIVLRSLLDGGELHCGGCRESFLFYEEARSHEACCASRLAAPLAS